jgi:hypothetical protein
MREADHKRHVDDDAIAEVVTREMRNDLFETGCRWVCRVDRCCVLRERISLKMPLGAQHA